MSGERLTLDSNILFYTIDADAGELQERAREVVRQAARSDCFLSLQTLSGLRDRPPQAVLAREEENDRPQRKREREHLERRPEDLPPREAVEERSQGLLVVERYLAGLEHGGRGSESRGGVGEGEDGAKLKRDEQSSRCLDPSKPGRGDAGEHRGVGEDGIPIDSWAEVGAASVNSVVSDPDAIPAWDLFDGLIEAGPREKAIESSGSEDQCFEHGIDCLTLRCYPS